MSKGKTLPNSRLKGLVRIELETKPDTGEEVAVWSGWLWKYHQVVKHSTTKAERMYLGQGKAGKLFRDWWDWGGLEGERPSEEELERLTEAMKQEGQAKALPADATSEGSASGSRPRKRRRGNKSKDASRDRKSVV